MDSTKILIDNSHLKSIFKNVAHRRMFFWLTTKQSVMCQRPAQTDNKSMHFDRPHLLKLFQKIQITFFFFTLNYKIINQVIFTCIYKTSSFKLLFAYKTFKACLAGSLAHFRGRSSLPHAPFPCVWQNNYFRITKKMLFNTFSCFLILNNHSFISKWRAAKIAFLWSRNNCFPIESRQFG